MEQRITAANGIVKVWLDEHLLEAPIADTRALEGLRKNCESAGATATADRLSKIIDQVSAPLPRDPQPLLEQLRAQDRHTKAALFDETLDQKLVDEADLDHEVRTHILKRLKDREIHT